MGIFSIFKNREKRKEAGFPLAEAADGYVQR